MRALLAALPWRDNLRDPRAIALITAGVFALSAIALPPISTRRFGVDAIAVVDITGSMNVRDALIAGRPAARLALAKAALVDMLGRLPCPSRLGLALFTERVPFLLFEPVDVCRDYGALVGAIDAVDWREGWEGDSHISSGLMNAIDMARSLHSDLIFLTDGQEAPPLPPTGGTPFVGTKGDVRGLVAGIGGYALSPIPKFDDRGAEIGFWGVDDVPHESRFGPPPVDAESRPGFEARNAPFGAVAPGGAEHLSAVREPYLRSLSDETGLTYVHLANTGDLADPLLAAAKPRVSRGANDLRWIFGLLSLLATLFAYAAAPSHRLLTRLGSPLAKAR